MKTILIALLIVFCASLYSTMPAAWTDFQKDIGIQAARYQNSAEHQALKQSRDSRTYVVGDTETFWRWNLSVMPPSWVQAPATCRAVGEHCYVFVANSDWGSHMSQANVDSVLVRLEDNTPNNPTQGAIEMDINLFGQVPDELDNDPKLIVFYSALGSFQGTSFDGYFSAYNQVTEAEAQQMSPTGHSNECEMIYMTCYPLSPVAPIRLSVLSHELEHLIHWGQDADEETWIDEGCAELAMVAYGVPDPISSFPSNPDNSLNVWNQATADYVKVMLFFTYLKEHYDDTGLIAALIADPSNGMPSFNHQAGIHYPGLTGSKIIRNWTVANVIDSPLPEDGLFDYAELDLPNFAMTSVNAHPSMTSASILPYAADYLSYTLPEETMSISLQATPEVHFSLLTFNNVNECIAVDDAGLTTQVDFNLLPADASRVVVVITNSGATGATYSYTTATVGNADAITTPATATMACYPNPVNATSALRITISNATKATDSKVDIYNLKGQRIRRLDLTQANAAQESSVSWDGKNDLHQNVGNGMYLVKYNAGRRMLSKAVFLNR